MNKIALSWSGGKDSAMALHALRRGGRREGGEGEVATLLCTVAGAFDRVSHHGVRTTLLQEQAAAVSVPLRQVVLPEGEEGMEHYEALMERTLASLKAKGFTGVAFGDIFLADLRAYRERTLARVGLKGHFPLWGKNTAELMRTFLDAGFRAVIACVDGRKLNAAFAGQAVTSELLAKFPPGVDPCGENGEYHTFVHDGPEFSWPVEIEMGDVVHRDVRYFADLLPVNGQGERKA